MDISLIIATFIIFGLPIILIGGAALFPPELGDEPFDSPKDWGNQDLDQNLNK
jgi:hypothetical protein